MRTFNEELLMIKAEAPDIAARCQKKGFMIGENTVMQAWMSIRLDRYEPKSRAERELGLQIRAAIYLERTPHD